MQPTAACRNGMVPTNCRTPSSTIMKISFATSALVIAAAEAFHVGHSGRRTTSLNILAGAERWVEVFVVGDLMMCADALASPACRLPASHKSLIQILSSYLRIVPPIVLPRSCPSNPRKMPLSTSSSRRISPEPSRTKSSRPKLPASWRRKD